MSKSQTFWNKEYADPKHLTMSDEVSSDMETFERWSIRNAEWHPFPKGGLVLDVGCGNGRNLIQMSGTYDMKGIGFDISSTAIDLAKRAHLQKEKELGRKIAVDFLVQSAGEPLPVEDESVDVVIDAMTTHFLRQHERDLYIKELIRVVKPFGWVFFKTFVLDGDIHAKHLIRNHPDTGIQTLDDDGKIIKTGTPEKNSYIHPKIGVYEHVWTEADIHETFGPYFKIHKMIKSYKHIKDGKAFKRRTISVYMERKRDNVS
jgi:SAM-dependent methyltransferase